MKPLHDSDILYLERILKYIHFCIYFKSLCGAEIILYPPERFFNLKYLYL